jgi:hypothetical protein
VHLIRHARSAIECTVTVIPAGLGREIDVDPVEEHALFEKDDRRPLHEWAKGMADEREASIGHNDLSRGRQGRGDGVCVRPTHIVGQDGGDVTADIVGEAQAAYC